MSVPQLPAELWEIVFEETFSLEKYYQMLQEDNYRGVEILSNMFINQLHKNSYDKACCIRDEILDEWEAMDNIARECMMNYGEPLPDSPYWEYNGTTVNDNTSIYEDDDFLL